MTVLKLSRVPEAANTSRPQPNELGKTHIAQKNLAVKPEPPPCRTGAEFLSRIAPGILVAALLLSLGFPQDARADLQPMPGTLWFGNSDDPDDPAWVEWYIDDETLDVFISETDKDGSVSIEKVGNGGDPNPDDPSSKPEGDLNSLIAAAKQKGGKLFTDSDFWKSPLGQRLSAGGNGPGPVINPSDDGGGQGAPRNPSLGKEKLGAPQIFNKFGQVGSGHGGFQFDAGSPADQLKTHGGSPSGKGDGDGNDKGSHKPPPGSNFGPAELVDPLGPPTARDAAKGTKNGIWQPGKERQKVACRASVPNHITI